MVSASARATGEDLISRPAEEVERYNWSQAREEWVVAYSGRAG